MKLFKVVGKNKKATELAEFFLDNIDFESAMKDIEYESFIFNIPFENTNAYNAFLKKHRKR